MSGQPYYFGAFQIADEVNYYVTSKDLTVPSLQYVTEGVARVPGTKFSGFRVNERPITVTIRVVSATTPPTRADLESKIDALMAALQYRQQRLTLHQADGRYFIADCSDAKVAYVAGRPAMADVQCTFTCYQPYALAASQSTYTMSSVAFTGSSPYSSPIQQITGGGNVFNYPTLVITNTGSVAVTTTNIYQQTDGLQLTIVQTLNNNDTLSIYSDPLSTNGLSARYNNGNPLPFSGAFFLLEPVATNWLITAAAASAPTLQAVWTWQARYAN